MGTVGAIATVVGVGLQMVDKYIDDPVRRLAARQEMIDKIKEKMDGILEAKEMEELDNLLLNFISALHNL
jgi:uncharacterized membrane protein (DUF106 family)